MKGKNKGDGGQIRPGSTAGCSLSSGFQLMLNLHQAYNEDDLSFVWSTLPSIDDGIIKICLTANAAYCLARAVPPPTETIRQQSHGLVHLATPLRLRWLPSDTCKERLVGEGVPQQLDANLQLCLADLHSDFWFYVGECNANAERAEDIPVAVDFFLKNKLPRAVWLRCGGYAGFRVRIGSAYYYSSTTRELMRLIAEMWDMANDVEISRYEDDYLSAMTNEKGEATIHYYRPSDELELVSCNASVRGDSGEFEMFLKHGECEYEVSLGAVVARDEALRSIEHYLDAGEPEGLVRAF